MKNKNLQMLLGLGVLVGAVALIVHIKKKKVKKNSEPKSNFIGSPFGKRVMFTLKNNTNQMQVVPLFNSYSNIQNPNVGINPSIAEFNRTLLNDPKKITAIEVRAMGDQKQAQKPIQVFCKDASGDFKSSFLTPLVSAYQKATDMTTVTPNNFIANGECYLNYTVNPKKTVTLIIHYEEMKKSSLLNKRKKQVA